jgi:hypothetical protein
MNISDFLISAMTIGFEQLLTQEPLAIVTVGVKFESL